MFFRRGGDGIKIVKKISCILFFKRSQERGGSYRRKSGDTRKLLGMGAGEGGRSVKLEILVWKPRRGQQERADKNKSTSQFGVAPKTNLPKRNQPRKGRCRKQGIQGSRSIAKRRAPPGIMLTRGSKRHKMHLKKRIKKVP